MSEENGEAQGQISNEAAGPTIVENEAQQGGTRAEEDGKKRKVALHVAYIGAGYAGMQVNPGVTTIEGVLEAAIHHAGGISKDNFGDINKVKWMRSARTDKGVSAVGQVVSLKMLLVPGILQGINANLPPAIKVLGYCRVTGSFDARLHCDKRRYEYIIPDFAFNPKAYAAGSDSNPTAPPEGHVVEVTDADAKGSNEAAVSNNGFEFDAACQQRLNEVLKEYEGTHNYHNFTARMGGNDRAAKRYILSFSSPGTCQIKGQTWVRMVVTGQSFMLHQIRKMVGVAIAIMRGVAPRNAIQLALDPCRDVNTPIAPDVGLFLDESLFDSYNTRWGHNRNEVVSQEGHREEVNAFKEKELYPQIAERDRQEQCTANWLLKLHEHAEEFAAWELAPVCESPTQGPASKLNGKKTAKRKARDASSRPDTWSRQPKKQNPTGDPEGQKEASKTEGPSEALPGNEEAHVNEILSHQPEEKKSLQGASEIVSDNHAIDPVES